VFSAYDKNEAKLRKKIQFWESCVKKEIAECFLTLHDCLSELGTPVLSEIAPEMIEHQKISTNANLKIFAISKRRYELAPKSTRMT
jgi:hypothetical protein